MFGREIKRHIKLYGIFIRNSFRAQIEYRVNFIFSILTECGWVAAHLLYLLVLYQTDSMGDLPKDSIFIFSGAYLIITGVFMSCFFTNFSNISSYIRDGQLDILITKPISLQGMCSLRYFDFGYPIADYTGGIILIIIGFTKMNLMLSVWHILGFIAYLLLGVLWMYSLQIIPAIISFWTVQVNGIYSISYSIHDMNKMPMNVYDKRIRVLGTFLYPIFPMSNYPVLCVLNKLNHFQMIWGIVGPIVLFILVSMLWNVAVKKYASASS